MEWYHIYLWTRLDALECVFFIITLLGGFGCLITTIISIVLYCDEDDDLPKAIKMLKIFIAPFVISLSLLVFIPSSKDFAMMYVIPKMANSKVIQQDLPDIYDMAIKELKSRLGEKEKK